MAWSSPRTWVTNEVVTAAQLNQEVRDNLGCFASIIAYTDGALLSGWSDYSATAGGRYIVATPTSGSTGGTVGTALTNLQNKAAPTHLHTILSHIHGVGTLDAGAPSWAYWGNQTAGVWTLTAGSGNTGETVAVSTCDIAPYIQLLAMKKSA